MPDSSSKSGSPRQPSSRPPFSGDWPGIRFSSWNAGFQLKKRIPKTSSRPPFSGDWPGIRFSSWNAGFQLEKRIPKTTFITDPLFRRLAGNPLFELECRIPARKADPQDNLHHGAVRAGMPDSSSKNGSGRGSAFRVGSIGIGDTFITYPKPQDPLSQWSRPSSAIGIGLGCESRCDNELDSGPASSFRAGMPDSSSKSGSPRQPFPR